jgi:hypothetical protein
MVLAATHQPLPHLAPRRATFSKYDSWDRRNCRARALSFYTREQSLFSLNRGIPSLSASSWCRNAWNFICGPGTVTLTCISPARLRTVAAEQRCLRQRLERTGNAEGEGCGLEQGVWAGTWEMTDPSAEFRLLPRVSGQARTTHTHVNTYTRTHHSPTRMRPAPPSPYSRLHVHKLSQTVCREVRNGGKIGDIWRSGRVPRRVPRRAAHVTAPCHARDRAVPRT